MRTEKTTLPIRGPCKHGSTYEVHTYCNHSKTPNECIHKGEEILCPYYDARNPEGDENP